MIEENKNYSDALNEIKKTNPDINQVLSLLDASIKEGCSEAEYALATWYLHGKYVEKNLSKGVKLLKSACDKRSANACYDLANCYESGLGVGENLYEAFCLYVKAALYGDEQSIHEVGRCYYYGIGVKEDKGLSDIWLEKYETLSSK